MERYRHKFVGVQILSLCSRACPPSPLLYSGMSDEKDIEILAASIATVSIKEEKAHEFPLDDKYGALKKLGAALRNGDHKNVCFVTGAGISVSAGVSFILWTTARMCAFIANILCSVLSCTPLSHFIPYLIHCLS